MKPKNSKGLFAAVLSQLEDNKAVMPEKVARSNSPHLMKVADGVKKMQERSEIADALLRSGSQIVEIDPNKIHPSAIQDRFDGAYNSAALEEIIASMRERGQIVPGLVRPIAGKTDEFEIVYGRRRLLAAKHLGIAFKAAIRSLSDEEAIIFQGEENSARNDLSFIEKCLFAKAQEDAGFKRETICASLSTGKSHISEMIKLARILPVAMLQAIGKAPMIGRGRFAQLADMVGTFSPQVQYSCWNNIANQQDFAKLTDEERFNAFFDAFAAETRQNSRAGVVKQQSQQVRLNTSKTWHSKDHHVDIVMQKHDKKTILSFQQKSKSYKSASALKDAPHSNSDFVDYLTSQLDALYDAYQADLDTFKKGDD